MIPDTNNVGGRIVTISEVFDISRSSYYEYSQRWNHVDVEGLALKAQTACSSRTAVLLAARTIQCMLNDNGVVIGRVKVRRLMSELGLICKQPGPHAFNGGTSPVVAEENLKILSGIG